MDTYMLDRSRTFARPAARRRRGLKALVAALVLGALALAMPAPIHAEGLEVTEVRTDNYPRVIVRFSAGTSDGTPISNLKPGQLKVWEGDAAQSSVDFYSLRETSPELWVTLVMDVSGSMNDDGKLDQAKQAAKGFVSRLRSKDRMSIVTFSEKVVLHQQPTGDPGTLNRAIDSLQAKGPTRMNDGVARGVVEILRAREGGRRAVILLSDGDDTDSQVDMATAIAPAVAAKVPIYAIGLGTDVKAETLSGVASETKGRYYAAPQAKDLDTAFRLLAGQLATQYEAWWQSSTTIAPGSTISGRIRLDAPGNDLLETSFSYVVPLAFRPLPRPEAAAAPATLRPVEFARSSEWDLPEWWPLLAAALAAAGVYIGFYGGVVRVTRSRTEERLGIFVRAYQAGKNRLSPAKQSSNQSMRPLILSLARLTHKITPTRILDDLRHRLVLAGRPSGWHFSQFLAAKLLVAGILGTCGYFVLAASQAEPLTLMVSAFGLSVKGWYLPHFWLGAQIRARQKAIQRALPDALDLMTVGVGAGLSLDGAILEIVEKSDNQLSQELANFLAEMRMGRSRREALQGLDARTGVEDIKVLVASLIQADELGMSLSETLMVQADQMRLRRRQRAEELAHKATVKMMIPMIMLIFPALFIVIIGPAVPSMLEFLTKGAT